MDFPFPRPKKTQTGMTQNFITIAEMGATWHGSTLCKLLLIVPALPVDIPDFVVAIIRGGVAE